jgi:hypothetical protein
VFGEEIPANADEGVTAAGTRPGPQRAECKREGHGRGEKTNGAAEKNPNGNRERERSDESDATVPEPCPIAVPARILVHTRTTIEIDSA